MKLKANTYQALTTSLLMSLIWIILGITSGDEVLDIQWHDTYYVIAYISLVKFNVAVFCIYGLIYWFFLRSKQRLLWKLNIKHLALSVFGSLIFLLMAMLTGSFSNPDSWSSMNFEVSFFFIVAMLIGMVCMVLGPVLFSVNLMIVIFLSFIKNR